jgi:adenosine deaminase CECR1
MGGICSWEKGYEASSKARRLERRPDNGEDITQKVRSEKPEKISDKTFKTMADHTSPLTLDAYQAERASVLAAEKAEGFDGRAREQASELENRANEIVVAIRQRDAELVHGGELDMLGKVITPDKHFVGNASNISSTSLFKIAQQMPKGAHLHCHFNSCLPPQFLLRHAKNNAHMYIKSDLALNSEDNKERAEIQFQMHIIEDEKHLEPCGSLLHESYKSSFHVDDKRKGWYSYDKFLGEYPGGEAAAEEWLASKLLFTEEEVYGITQTTTKSVTSTTPLPLSII